MSTRGLFAAAVSVIVAIAFWACSAGGKTADPSPPEDDKHNATALPAGARVHYRLVISAKPDGFDGDSVSMSTSAAGGHGVVFVNNDPVDFYQGGAMSMQGINPWLVDGRNTVKL